MGIEKKKLGIPDRNITTEKDEQIIIKL